jgi:hypothetical protein
MQKDKRGWKGEIEKRNDDEQESFKPKSTESSHYTGYSRGHTVLRSDASHTTPPKMVTPTTATTPTMTITMTTPRLAVSVTAVMMGTSRAGNCNHSRCAVYVITFLDFSFFRVTV